MSDKLVTLDWSESARVPQTIILPMKLVALLGVERQYLIDAPDQQVPEAVKLWMQRHPRYEKLFAPEQVAKQPPQPAAESKKAAKLVQKQAEPKAAAQPQDDSPSSTVPNEAEDSGEEDDQDAAQSGADGENPSAGEDMPQTGGTQETWQQYPHAAWSQQWNVPDLRAYAKDQGVELKSADLRDDIIAKLKAANKPEQGAAKPEA